LLFLDDPEILAQSSFLYDLVQLYDLMV